MKSPVPYRTRWGWVVLRIVAGFSVVASLYVVSAAFSHTNPHVAIGMITAAKSIAALLLLMVLLVPRTRRLMGIRRRIRARESWSSFRKEILYLAILPAIGHRFLLFEFDLVAHLPRTERTVSWSLDLLIGVPLFLIGAAVCYWAAAKAITSMGGRTPGESEHHHVAVGLALGGLVSAAYSAVLLGLVALVGFPTLTWQLLTATGAVGVVVFFATLVFMQPVRVARN